MVSSNQLKLEAAAHGCDLAPMMPMPGSVLPSNKIGSTWNRAQQESGFSTDGMTEIIEKMRLSAAKQVVMAFSYKVLTIPQSVVGA